MIIVKFEGRLGNQMFQYAFALSASKKLGTIFLMDRLRKSILFDYFKTGYTFTSKEFNDNLVKNCRKILRKKIYQNNVNEVEGFKNKIINNSYYQGFFQSESYFHPFEDIVKNHLQVRYKYRKIFQIKYGEFFQQNKVIAIHCRLGDYLNWSIDDMGGENLTLPECYYKNALHQISGIENYKTIIVTDDLINFKGRFDFISEKIVVSENEIIDFQILQNAHIIISSNSTFSWWAAYLSKNAITIFAPKFWLGFKVKEEYPKGIIPRNWIQVEF